jgi:hypothetical protein
MKKTTQDTQYSVRIRNRHLPSKSLQRVRLNFKVLHRYFLKKMRYTSDDLKQVSGSRPRFEQGKSIIQVKKMPFFQSALLEVREEILSSVGGGGGCVTYKTGFGLDDWIYCTLYIHNSELQAI